MTGHRPARRVTATMIGGRGIPAASPATGGATIGPHQWRCPECGIIIHWRGDSAQVAQWVEDAVENHERSAHRPAARCDRLPDETTLDHWRVDVYAAFKCMCCGEPFDFGGDTDLWTVFEALHDHEDTCGLGTA